MKKRTWVLAGVLITVSIAANIVFLSYASDLHFENPHIDLFNKYVDEVDLDVKIEDMDLFRQSYANLSLHEWKDKLDEMFAEFELISRDTEPIVIQVSNNQSKMNNRNGLGDGVPGVSSDISYYNNGYLESSNNISNMGAGIPGVSSNDNFLIGLSSQEPENSIRSSPINYSLSLEGYASSVYRYKIVASGVIVFEGNDKVFNKVLWTAYNFPGQNYFHVEYFQNTVNKGSSASTQAVGYLKTSDGIVLTVLRTLNLTIHAEPIW